jgi:hypothetical protein
VRCGMGDRKRRSSNRTTIVLIDDLFPPILGILKSFHPGLVLYTRAREVAETDVELGVIIFVTVGLQAIHDPAARAKGSRVVSAAAIEVAGALLVE